MKLTTKIFGGLLGASFFLTMTGCPAASSFSGDASTIRIANLSVNLTTMDANLTDSILHSNALSHALPRGSDTCYASYSLSSGASTLELTAGGSTVNLLTKAMTIESGEPLSTILVFGPQSGLKTELINSLEVPGPYSLFISDLSVLDTTNYQVIVKNVPANTSDQTSPVSGVDGSRTVAYNITTPSTYEVDLVSGGTVVVSGTVVIDAGHVHNIIAFTDNPAGGGGLVANVIRDAQGCVTP